MLNLVIIFMQGPSNFLGGSRFELCNSSNLFKEAPPNLLSCLKTMILLFLCYIVNKVLCLSTGNVIY